VSDHSTQKRLGLIEEKLGLSWDRYIGLNCGGFASLALDLFNDGLRIGCAQRS
jgi:hypothetical protein